MPLVTKAHITCLPDKQAITPLARYLMRHFILLSENPYPPQPNAYQGQPMAQGLLQYFSKGDQILNTLDTNFIDADNKKLGNGICTSLREKMKPWSLLAHSCRSLSPVPIT